MVPLVSGVLHVYVQLLILSFKIMPFAMIIQWLCGPMSRRAAPHEARVRAWLRGEPMQ